MKGANLWNYVQTVKITLLLWKADVGYVCVVVIQCAVKQYMILNVRTRLKKSSLIIAIFF